AQCAAICCGSGGMIFLLVIPAKAGIQLLALASASTSALPEKNRSWITRRSAARPSGQLRCSLRHPAFAVRLSPE
ncbi:MAG TPA: hypothetical protein VFI49_05290, partial [Rudaea sp.]|nr:hypothetical protein [Rudaea sp.]